jgi:hypothetical protein
LIAALKASFICTRTERFSCDIAGQYRGQPESVARGLPLRTAMKEGPLR